MKTAAVIGARRAGRVRQRTGQIGRRSHVRPRAVVALAADEAARDPVVQERQQLEFHAARRIAEEPRVEDTDVAVSEPRGAVAVDARALQREVAGRVIRWIGHQHEVHAGRRIVERHGIGHRSQGRVIEGRPDVARDDRHRTLRKLRKRGDDAARGLERLGLARPGDSHAVRAPVAQGRHQLLRAVRDIDHERAVARTRERLDLPDDERLAADGEERLGRRVGQRTQALAAASRKDHRGAHQNV